MPPPVARGTCSLAAVLTRIPLADRSTAHPAPSLLSPTHPDMRADHAGAARAAPLLLLCTLLSLLVSPTLAHSSGADAQACAAGSASQMPGHGYDFQTSVSPFSVSAPSPSYTAGGAAVGFTVASSDGSTYEGFLCSVFYIADTAGATRVGQVNPGAGLANTRSVCVTGSNGGITHSPATPLASRSFLWTPPPASSAGQGAVMIQCTIVTSYSTYWKLAPFTLSEVVVAPQAPPSPTNLRLTDALVVADGTSTLTFGFNAPTTQTFVDKYVLEFWPASTPSLVKSANVTKVDTTTSYSVSASALTASTAYSFRLRSFNAASGFQTAPALTLTATTSSLASAVPAATPSRSNTSLSIVSGAVVIDLRSFAPTSDAPLIGYEVQWRLSSESTYGSHPSIFAPLAQGNASIPGLATGQVIFVQVRAKSMRGTGAFGPEIRFGVTSLCPNACSGNGVCMASSSACACDPGFLSADCSIPSRVVGGAQCFGEYCIDFGLEGTTSPLTRDSVTKVHVQLSAATAGWVGFLLNAKDGMTNGAGFYFTRDAATGATSTWPIYATIKNQPELVDGGMDVSGSAQSYTSATDSRVTVYSFTKDVSVSPQFVLSGEQRFSYAWSTQSAFLQHDRPVGKLFIDWYAGTIKKVPGTNYLMIYTSMIVFVGATLFLAFVFSKIPALRYCAVGNGVFQRRVGNWSGKTGGALGLATVDLWPTIQDLLLGEVAILSMYAACLAVFIAVGYREFDKAGYPAPFTWGHVTAMHYAFLLMPVNRNSIWAWLFSSSFERLVKWHRIIGRLALVFNYTHMITMSYHYGIGVGTSRPVLLKGVIALIFFSITAAAGWEPIRRGYWKIFITVHLVCAPIGYVFAFLHVKYVIWFCTPVLVLLVVDYLFRWIIRPSIIHSNVKVVEARVLVDAGAPQGGGPSKEVELTRNPIRVGEVMAIDGGINSSVGRVTRLTLDVTGFSQSFEPGAYCYLQIPSISLNEFHPFSISCYPTVTRGVSRLTFHILDMGRDSFTHRLFNRIQNASAADIASMRVRVDGPYGRLQVDLTRYKTIVLVAGGIGITPFLSILEWLAEQKIHCTVHLIWTSRVKSSFGAWSGALLHRIHEGQSTSKFHFHLYSSTGAAGASGIEMAPMGSDAPVQGAWQPVLTPGRPDIAGLFSGFASDAAEVDLTSLPAHHVAAKTHRKPHTVAVLACGPAGLVASAQSAARTHGFHFHKETFVF